VSYPVFLGAVVITAANNKIRFKEGAGAVTNAVIGTGTYYLRPGVLSASDLGLAIQSALGSAGPSANNYSVSVTPSIDPANPGMTLTVTRTSGSDDFSIVVDGNETFDMDLIGITTTTAHDASPKTSTLSCAAAWVGNDILREREPFGERIADVSRRVNGGVVGVSRSAHMVSWALGLAFVEERRMLLRANASDEGATLEAFVRRFGAGAAFEAHEVPISSGTTLGNMSLSTRFGVLHWSADSVTGFRPRRIGPGVPLYDLDMVAHEQVV
jgi:hypothetical protein